MTQKKKEKMIFPRPLAVKALVRVLSQHQPLDEALAELSGELPPNGLPWLQEMASGTLRWKGRLDFILDSISMKKKPSGWLRKMLLLASYQLVAQDRTPAAMVVNETVASIKSKEGEAPANFANACLRKVADHAQKWRNLPFPGGRSVSEIAPEDFKAHAAWASLPEWLWAKLVYQRGLEWAQKYAIASLERPTLWIRQNPAKDLVPASELENAATVSTTLLNSQVSPALEPGSTLVPASELNGLSDEGSDVNAQSELGAETSLDAQAKRTLTPGPVPYSWKDETGGAITAKHGFHQGAFIVQDISSQLLIHEVSQKIFELTGNVGLTSFSERSGSSSKNQPLKALDLCAAPGGKAVGLAWSGFQVTATDRTEARMPLLEQTVARVMGSSESPSLQVIPWSQIPQLEPQDLTWIDAPCSGTGILRRHPDVRWLRQEKEVAALTRTQRELLTSTWERTPAGGFVVYSVCSVLREEGPDAIRNTDLQASVIQEWFLSPQDSPHGDGFWAVLLRK